MSLTMTMVQLSTLQSGSGSLTFPRVALRITVASVANLRSPMIDLRRPCPGRHMWPWAVSDYGHVDRERRSLASKAKPGTRDCRE